MTTVLYFSALVLFQLHCFVTITSHPSMDDHCRVIFITGDADEPTDAVDESSPAYWSHLIVWEVSNQQASASSS